LKTESEAYEITMLTATSDSALNIPGSGTVAITVSGAKDAEASKREDNEEEPKFLEPH
jgi:hypothetical protein